ncbi:MAG: hypothetical protein EHM77_04780 [Planctomycetaceae bacterium]|nr:MAG: hypothetical protein EHM77_04780 [Planctomycetaceae bacterium]
MIRVPQGVKGVKGVKGVARRRPPDGPVDPPDRMADRIPIRFCIPSPVVTYGFEACRLRSRV